MRTFVTERVKILYVHVHVHVCIEILSMYVCVYQTCHFQNGGGPASIFTGEEEVFAFERTISRLQEMQGDEYWNTMDRDNTPISADMSRHS